MSELKPCPFCGEEAKLLDKTNYYETGGYTYYFVRCNNCGAENGWNMQLEKAIEAWNRRVEE